MFRGPRAQDRIIALDTLYVNAMLLQQQPAFEQDRGREETNVA